MRLKAARVRDFKSVTDSGWVRIDESVTSLVGKNESGKTAFLEALYRLNPIPSGHPDGFDGLRDFPRSRWADEREDVGATTIAIEAIFELEGADIAIVEEDLGEGVLPKPEIRITKTYADTRSWYIDLDEQAAVRHLLQRHGADRQLAKGITSIRELAEKLEADEGAGPAELVEAVQSLDPVRDRVRRLLVPRLPRFFYFDEYSELPGRVSIDHLQRTDEGDLDPGAHTALSLLRLAGVDAEEFTEENYEPRRASLEAASSQITREVFDYWSQNKNLRVQFDVDFTASAPRPEPQPPFLEIRIENLRHFITLNFDERSAGFQWFFSFLAAFSEFRRAKLPIILLLDEPALGLHAKAQADLLRYIEERLAVKHQVIYTTHSPFMIDPAQLARVRTVEDIEDEGTRVSEDVLATSADTRFPLQAALGYEMAQSLFVAPDNLVVEGPADYIYLQVISEHLRSQGREGLDDRWVIVPVGGLDKIPTFIALLGTQLNVAVVLDGAAGGNQKINSLIDRGLIDAKAVLPLARIIGSKQADIEDMFEVGFYLKLVKGAGVGSVTKASLPKGERVVARIESVLGRRYDHYQPARYFLEEQRKLVPQVNEGTLDRFEALFHAANETLS